jgi:hypothetical protein
MLVMREIGSGYRAPAAIFAEPLKEENFLTSQIVHFLDRDQLGGRSKLPGTSSYQSGCHRETHWCALAYRVNSLASSREPQTQ